MSRLRNKLAMLSGRDTVLSEQYRALRVQLEQGDKDEKQIVAVITPSVGNGAEEVAANLAIASAQAGKRTLLLDGDMRAPMIHQVFGLSNAVGFSDVLEGRSKLESAVQRDVHPNLAVLTAGLRTTVPGDLIGSYPLADLLAQWRTTYDAVWLNTPPMLSSADALLLASECDRSLLVIREGVVTEADAAQLKRIIDNADIPVIGTILTHHRRRKWLSFG